MDQTDAIIAMQNYISDHMEDDISLTDLAKVSFYSPWYSYRLFIEYLHVSPSNYIRRLRLSKSALQLRDENSRITDVAFQAGYESVEGYQRAFQKEFGINPGEYAKNPIPIYLFIPYRLQKEKEKKKMNPVQNVFLTIIEKPKRKVIIKRGIKADNYFDYCEEVGCDIWGMLTSMKSLANEPVCLWLPQQYIKQNTSSYVQGVEVAMDYKGSIPEGMDVIELPEATYLMFQGEPFAEEDYQEAISVLWDAMEKYNPSAIGYEWDKTNPEIQLEPIGKRGYIELKPIKKIVKQ
ncbi:MAG: helix-turn-helix domain-containing protein [Bacilli bacterium]|nr:helix-turn-helix domain-containing protein [Bacilli bacterium]